MAFAPSSISSSFLSTEQPLLPQAIAMALEDQMDPQLQDIETGTQQEQQQGQQAEAVSEAKPEASTAPADQQPAVKDVGEVEATDESHPAFLPSLQYTSGNDLSSIASYDPQHAPGGPLRTGETDASAQTFDHWPADTQNQVAEDASLQNANQFAQGDHANQFAQHPDQSQYVHPTHQQPYQHGGTPYDRPTPGASYGTYDGSKPKRKRASPQQLTLLSNIFEMTYFPSSDLRLAIGKELDMVPRSVQIWFQNRRSMWRAKAAQILAENKQRKDELLASGMTEADADAKVTSDRAEAAARQIADQRANDAVEYAINGNNGSLAYALHSANTNPVAPGSVDDGSVTRDDEAGAWSVLQAFHQARTGVLVHQGHANPHIHMQQHQQHEQYQHHQQQLHQQQYHQQQQQQQQHYHVQQHQQQPAHQIPEAQPQQPAPTPEVAVQPQPERVVTQEVPQQEMHDMQDIQNIGEVPNLQDGQEAQNEQEAQIGPETQNGSEAQTGPEAQIEQEAQKTQETHDVPQVPEVEPKLLEPEPQAETAVQDLGEKSTEQEPPMSSNAME